MKILQTTGLGDTVTSRRLSLFGHVARSQNTVPLPANSGLRLMVYHYEGRIPDPSWIRRSGQSRHTCRLHHIQQDSGVTPSTAWDSEVARDMEQCNGHRLHAHQWNLQT